MSTLEKLDQKLINLKLRKYQIECSDDFAYTNSKISKIDQEIYEIEQQMKELEKENAKP